MRARTGLLTVFLVVNIALAGCTNLPGGTTAETTTTEPPTKTITTTKTTPDTTGEPQKGDNLLSVSAVDNDTVEAVNASAKANFSELNETQQEVFLEAHECDCNVNQDVFRFNDKDRFEYVRYEGQWYFLRVSIV
ncbi:hypothetical protein [Halorubellus salinus]|uniref:hypothetical protein n=1 Tax=Halorubellus salinus TaxID=755309 RepID=UPI001D087F2F|nr:hypothetical protein [Halorubellus salinus]